MTQERQDGLVKFYFVKWQPDGEWEPACQDHHGWMALGLGLESKAVPRNPWEIGPRIPSPDEPKDPDLLAVVAAARRFMHAHDTNPYEEVIERRTKALRSALAKVKMEGS